MQAFGAPAIAILVFAIILIFTMVKSVPPGRELDRGALRPLHPHPRARACASWCR